MPFNRPDSPLLIRTKLYPPRGRDGTLVRPRLLQKLQAGKSCRLTLLSAPAGYGKTTLLQHWLNVERHPHAWLSIDEYDDTVTTFVAYLAAAVQTACEDALPQTLALALSSSPPGTGQLADTLAGELEELPRPLILVLDDYHNVRVPEIHTFMNRLLEHLPPAVQLVVSTRTDPPFALAALRGRGQIAEIRGQNLRFTLDESADLLKRVAGERLAEQTVTNVAERTEGWPVGLQLAVLSLQDIDDRESFARRFAGGSNWLITDYLVREVLNKLPEQRRSLMLRTSLLERFCAPLCEWIAVGPVQRGDGAAFIRDIWASNLFLTSLDAEVAAMASAKFAQS